MKLVEPDKLVADPSLEVGSISIVISRDNQSVVVSHFGMMLDPSPYNLSPKQY